MAEADVTESSVKTEFTPPKQERPAPRTPQIPKQTIRAKLHTGKMSNLSHRISEWAAEIPAGTSYKTILTPDYWVHYAAKLRPGDEIRAMPEDGAWYAWLKVMFVSVAEVKVSTIHFADLDAAVAEENEEYSVEWKGPGAKFCVIHRPTKSMLKDKLYPKDEAYAWIREHSKSMRA